MRVLGIESSCDELAFAILDRDGKTLLANVIHSQIDLHNKFGGVVPEVASRDHVAQLSHVFQRTLSEAQLQISDLDSIAVTRGPGLVGSLLCGLEFAKGLALATQKPLVGVHHLEGHIAAAFLEAEAPEPPFVALLVSGGHTLLILVHALGGPYERLGSTRDDAAGEAFDKTAKLLGLGYPGGVAIDRLSETGNPEKFPFPTLMAGKDNFDFSFSGLKTWAARLIREAEPKLEGQALADFCASIQAAITHNLVGKAMRVTKKTNTKQLVLGGGVAANRHLRAVAQQCAQKERIQLFLPSPAFCTDNAAMVARAGWTRLRRGERSGFELSVRAHWPLEDLNPA